MFKIVAFLASSLLLVHAQTYSATYLPSSAPDHTEEGQTGTNKCGGGSSQTSTCQNAYLNSPDDFCLFAPPEPGPASTIGNTERIEVSWCIQDGYGTRLIPNGAIQGVHFVQTPDFVQVTGVGDLTKLNIPNGDTGGELDPHGADGNGNPIGGLVFSSAFGQLEQLHEWTNFMSSSEFCFRGCKPGPGAPTWCQHIYDVMGCMWNMPANYDAGTFERCQADSGEPMGVYGTSTFHQGDPVTPAAHPIPSSSMCTRLSTIGNGLAVSSPSTTAIISSVSPTTAASSTSSAASSTLAVSSITAVSSIASSGSSAPSSGSSAALSPSSSGASGTSTLASSSRSGGSSSTSGQQSSTSQTATLISSSGGNSPTSAVNANGAHELLRFGTREIATFGVLLLGMTVML